MTSKRTPGQTEKREDGWWIVVPPYRCDDGHFDTIGPYATKSEATAAWAQLKRSVQGWDRSYGKEGHDHLEGVDQSG